MAICNKYLINLYQYLGTRYVLITRFMEQVFINQSNNIAIDKSNFGIELPALNISIANLQRGALFDSNRDKR